MNFENLNEQQKAAVEYKGKHLLVLAGAGTGKTITIVARAAFLIQSGVNPSKIQILSFTRKSAKEIVDRIRMIFPDNDECQKINGSTFHSWCMDIIKNNPKVFTNGSKYTILDGDDQISAFKLVASKKIKNFEGEYIQPSEFLRVYSYAVNTRKNLSESLRHIIYSNCKTVEINQYIEENKKIFGNIIKKYIQYKQEHNYLDYDDILAIVSKSLKDNKDAQDYISSLFSHILIDEVQDTNPLQWELLSHFWDKSKLFCVGDDAQSIYGFRGADFKCVHAFKTLVPQSDVYKLTVNYRSTQKILNLSNWLLNKSPLNYEKELISSRGEGILPQIVNTYNGWEDASYVSADIAKNITDNDKKYADHLVLSRSSFGMRKIEAAFIENKIPYKVLGGFQLQKSAHILDVIAALKIVDNIYDEIAWIRYLQLWEGIGNITASKFITEILNKNNIDEVILYLKANYHKNSNMIQTLDSIKGLLNNPSVAITLAVKHMESILKNRYKENWEEKRKEDFTIVKQLAGAKNSITEFIAEFSIDPVLNESYLTGSDSNDVVTLSTIHSAKGLEADTCYVINVSPGIFPTSSSINDGNDTIEEDRRCLYVALTRAKNRLIITRNIYAGQEYGNINEESEYYFLNGLPNNLVNNITGQSNNSFSKPEYTGKPINNLQSDFDFD